MASEGKKRSAVRDVPYMGVIWVVNEAEKLGFTNGDPDWCNLGQGQPEVGDMDGAPERLSQMAVLPEDHQYGPVAGTPQLRQAIADHYNRLYRQNHDSKYGIENVSVACGGRLMLSRAFAIIDAVNLGYVIPDYTAYEDMLDYHRHRFTPKAVWSPPEKGFTITSEQLEREIRDQQLGAFVMSNPCNPTGVVIQGEELARYVELARTTDCMLLMDEFYSHFMYNPNGGPAPGPVSSAPYIEDVNEDPVLIIDGLTKCYRYPGWRIGWAVGPRDMIENLSRAASAIDGGPSKPLQRLAIEALEPSRADQETNALRSGFAAKRDLMVERLRAMGIRPAHDSESTFYVWASIEDLPAPLNDAEVFFHEGLKHKVMTVPGKYFDVNPGHLRTGESPFKQWVRFSFGPPIDNVRLGLDRLQKMIASHKVESASNA